MHNNAAQNQAMQEYEKTQIYINIHPYTMVGTQNPAFSENIRKYTYIFDLTSGRTDTVPGSIRRCEWGSCMECSTRGSQGSGGNLGLTVDLEVSL